MCHLHGIIHRQLDCIHRVMRNQTGPCELCSLCNPRPQSPAAAPRLAEDHILQAPEEGTLLREDLASKDLLPRVRHPFETEIDRTPGIL